jgi:hypothetical protein
MDISGWWIVVIIVIWAIDSQCRANLINDFKRELFSKLDELNKNKD